MSLERGKAEAVIKKIVALRALTVANGATEAEATAARRMAAKLMQRNGLSEDQITPMELDEVEDDEETVERRPFPVSPLMAGVGLAMLGVAAVIALMQTPEDGEQGGAVIASLREIAQGASLDSEAAALRLETAPEAGPEETGEPPIPPEEARAYLSHARISLHFETEAAGAEAEHLAERLQQAEAGLEDPGLVELRRVPIKIARTHVRYFSAESRKAARAALALLGDTLADPAARAAIDPSPRDFSSFTPQPPPNTIEIWMSSL